MDEIQGKAKRHADGGGKVVARKRPIVGRSQPSSASVKPLGVVFVSAKAPFMSVVNRAIKILDRGPGGARWSSTTALPLAARIAKVQEASEAAADAATAPFHSGAHAKAARQREVLLLASGHAIGSKLVPVAAWFRRQPGYVVTVRTRWSSTVDELFFFEAEGGGDDRDGQGADENAADNAGADGDAKADGAEEVGQDGDAPKERLARRTTRLRNVSVLEVAVRLA